MFLDDSSSSSFQPRPKLTKRRSTAAAKIDRELAALDADFRSGGGQKSARRRAAYRRWPILYKLAAVCFIILSALASFQLFFGEALERRRATLDFLRDAVGQVTRETFADSKELIAAIRSARQPPAIMMLNRHAFPITANWLCGIATEWPGVFDKLVMLALDDEAQDMLQDKFPSIRTVRWNVPAMTDRFGMGEGGYQMFQLLRANLAGWLAEEGIDHWWIQSDTHWSQNLFQVFNTSSIDFIARDLIFDADDESGFYARMIAGGCFFVRASRRTSHFFARLAESLLSTYATDNVLMSADCASNSAEISCGFFPYRLVSNWRWRLGKRDFLPALMQFDELGAEPKLMKMRRLGANFSDDQGNCYESVASTKSAISLKTMRMDALDTSRSAMRRIVFFHHAVNLVAGLHTSLDYWLRVHGVPSFAYLAVLA